MNKAAKLASFDYLLYSHDDMYFCPDWDDVLIKEIKSIKHENFYLSGLGLEGATHFYVVTDPDPLLLNDQEINKFPVQDSIKKVYEKQLIGSGFNASLDFTTTDKSKPYSIDMATFDYIEHSHS